MINGATHQKRLMMTAMEAPSLSLKRGTLRMVPLGTADILLLNRSLLVDIRDLKPPRLSFLRFISLVGDP